MLTNPSRFLAASIFFLFSAAVADLAPAAAAAAAGTPGRAVDAYLAAYSAGDVDRLLATYTDDIAFVDVSQRHEVKGQTAMRAQLEGLKAMHKSMQVEEKRRATTGRLVTVEVVYSGTLDCAALGAPDHEDVSYSLPAVLLFEVDGDRIRSQTDYLDFRTLAELQQSLQPASPQP